MGVPVEFMGDSPGNRPRARVESRVMEKLDIRMELAGCILPAILPAFLRPDAALPVKPGNSPGKRMRIRGIPREKAAMRRHVPGKLPGEFRRYASAGNSPNFPAGAPYFPGNAASDAFRGKLDWQPWHFPGNSREIAARQPDSPPSSYSARWAARCNRRPVTSQVRNAACEFREKAPPDYGPSQHTEYSAACEFFAAYYYRAC